MSTSDKMSPDSSTSQAFADVKLTAHHLILRGMRLPVAADHVFSGLAALAMVMLGHPMIAAIAKASSGVEALEALAAMVWAVEGPAKTDEANSAVPIAV